MLKRYLLLLIAICTIAPLGAVTNEEMEQARAIAAKYYLRYTNDGSGYLDEVEATSMTQLKSHLKTKEVENLKAFTAVSTPSDYASWSKDQLVEYWSKTFFKSAGLSEKGQGAKRRIAAKINAMSVSAPKAEEPAKKEETTAPEETVETVPAGDIPEALIEEKAQEVAAADSALAQAQEDIAESVPESKNSSGSTMIYVVILIILVIAVVCLVVYAVNNMKRNEQNRHAARPSDDNRAEVEAKDEEIRRLRSEFAELKRRHSEQNEQTAALSRELADSRRETENLRRTRTAPAPTPIVEPEPRREAAAPRAAAPRRLHTIYLAKANAKGVFVRADRSVVPGQTVFKLETSDGVSGSFSVVDDPEVWNMALMMPDEYIVTGCTGRNLYATSGFDRIETETPGTAIFEGGVWKVIRKAKISYS